MALRGGIFMYNDEEIEKLFENHIVDETYFKKYVDIYKYFKINETKDDRFNFHHFFPVNYGKEILNEKNRYHTIKKHDEFYAIENNVVKLPIKWHIIAHYILAKATFRKDDINSFFTLIGNYDRNIESYSFNEVESLAELIEENSEPNQTEHYMTQSETKEYLKQKQKDYMEDWAEKHEEEILRNEEFIKQKRKESQKKWKEEHKDEIEERKRQQREYAKQMRAKYKANLSK
jgi:hypothetical protein